MLVRMMAQMSMFGTLLMVVIMVDLNLYLENESLLSLSAFLVLLLAIEDQPVTPRFSISM